MTTFTKLSSALAATGPVFAMICGLGVATVMTTAVTGFESDARKSFDHSRRGARTVVAAETSTPALLGTAIDRRGARSLQVYALNTLPMTATPTDRVRITARH